LDLQQVEVRDFRAFRHALVELPCAGLVLVAGANNTGKTALLSALDVIAGRGTPPRVRHADASRPTEVLARFILPESERRRLLGEVAEEAIFRRGAFSWVEWIFREDQNGSLVPLELRAPWPGHGTIVVAQGSTPPDSVISVGNVIQALRGQSDEDIDAVKTRLPASDILGAIGALGYEEPGLLLQFLNDWRNSFFHFYALRTGTTRSRALSSEERLTFSGENVPGVLLHLQHNDPTRWEEIRRLMAEAVPDLGLLETATSGAQIEVVFRDPHSPTFRHNLKDLGTGVEQLLMTVVMGVTQPTPSTVVIEEPETNLHPAAQRSLLNLLRDWGADRLLLVSTHSPVFLDRAVGTIPVLVTRRAGGASTVAPFTQDLSEALVALGARRNELLTADRLLFVEGPSDQDILTVWFPEKMRNPRLVVISGQGGDNALHADRLAAWIEAADALHGRRVLYLRDRDELPTRLLDRLQRSAAVHVLECRELENYLLDTGAIEKVLISRLSELAISQTEVTTRMKQIADDLRIAVLVKRVAWELAPVALADHKLRDSLAQGKATLEQFQGVVLGRLPEKAELASHIAGLWRVTDDAIRAEWEDRWRCLVPGHDVLARLWSAYGIAYDKQRDGSAIAKLVEPPPELQVVLDDFLRN
jgi:predicted ATPase